MGTNRLAAVIVLTLAWHGSEVVAGEPAPSPPVAAPPAVDFATQILPIFTTKCLDCHGPDRQENNLRVDRQASLLRGGDSGEPSLIPAQSAKSPLYQLVSGTDPSGQVMPPDADARLSAAELALLQTWIDAGAPWPAEHDAPEAESTALDHWAFQPVTRPPLPPIQSDWITNGIDAWVLKGLRENQLSHNPAASDRELVRRLYLDVIGLPPAPADAQAMLQQPITPASWEPLVDRILASPHYGERWAHYWLDLVRFAETAGFEMNRERPDAWPYRDYVIQSLNDDKPYDRFLREQIAGDACGAPEGTAYLVAGPRDEVSSPDINLTRMQRQNELDDMISTTGTAFLGMTIGCARCHHHKFDPIRQSDYYAIQAIFAGVRHQARPITVAKTNRSQTVYAGNFQPPPPTHRLFRGDPLAPREQVAPDTVAVLGSLQLPPQATEQQRRLAFAKWVSAPQNPLTARVICNRLWQYHFGKGLVTTPGDFGLSGVRPSHPELLDWLAAELIEHDWSLKHVHRLILTSATWRQSSAPRPESLAVDAATRYWWRFPPRRLEAEPIRDSILAVSGVLDLAPYGPGFSAFEIVAENVRHYHPKASYGPADWRRMVYMTKVRQEQDSVFGIFDCPNASTSVPERSRSTTPLQALNLFNSHFMIQQATLMARRLRIEIAAGGPETLVHRAFWLCYSRAPNKAELQDATEFVQSHGLEAFCRAMLNSNEFLFLL